MPRKLQILGTGCPKCAKLAANTEAAATSLGMDYELVKITDIAEIMKFSVMLTPTLAIDGEVAVVGKVPSPAEIMTILATKEAEDA